MSTAIKQYIALSKCSAQKEPQQKMIARQLNIVLRCTYLIMKLRDQLLLQGTFNFIRFSKVEIKLRVIWILHLKLCSGFDCTIVMSRLSRLTSGHEKFSALLQHPPAQIISLPQLQSPLAS